MPVPFFIESVSLKLKYPVKIQQGIVAKRTPHSLFPKMDMPNLIKRATIGG